MEKKIVGIDGEKYQVINCPKCGQELKFKMHKERRRVYAKCCKCLLELAVEVDAL